ncbi:tribbles homolog 2-like [Thrips palmi]|uniref:Tribbles homolog 2-like n=1 Tax=Thrips palmi TaxID=161013 RepID=A0A6P8XUC3_THRPL|nr:tribbles homolog 2-like [Thrips palmi]
MQEDTSSSSHEVSELLFRTKDQGPSGVVPDEPAEGPEGSDGSEGPDGPEGSDVPDGAPPTSGGHGSALGMFKNLLPAFGAPLTPVTTSASGPCPSAGEPPGLSMPAQSPLNAIADPSPRIAPVTFVANKYVLLDKVDGSSFFNCIDINTREQLVCKVVGREAGSLLSAHFRVDGHPGLNPLREVMLGPHGAHGSRHMYLIFPAAHGDLHTHVRTRRRLRESEARRLFRQMAECVRHCHEAGIVLRDLKLRKFVFTDRQRTTLKLESLEDAVVLDSPEDDLLQDKRGCPAYVSPEILRSHTQYSGRAADMWSLGVILYTTLVGRYPFNDTEHASLFAKISRGHYVMPEWLGHKARCLIRSLLRRDPSERLTAEDVLRHPWLQQDRDGLGDDAGGDLHHHHHHHADSASDQLVPDVM